MINRLLDLPGIGQVRLSPYEIEVRPTFVVAWTKLHDEILEDKPIDKQVILPVMFYIADQAKDLVGRARSIVLSGRL